MEKGKPHYDLNLIKKMVHKGHWHLTLTAQRNALEDFELDLGGIKKVIFDLLPDHFYKSMTTHHDTSLWQDVYRPLIGSRKAYLKIQVASPPTAVVIQLKKL